MCQALRLGDRMRPRWTHSCFHGAFILASLDSEWHLTISERANLCLKEELSAPSQFLKMKGLRFTWLIMFKKESRP